MDTWNGGPQIFNFPIWSNLCISAPSASFERCFSSADLTVSEFRMQLKVNLHSIRFSYVFVRFFTFLLLLDKVCAFPSAFLWVHIRTNQTVTYCTKVFWKKFFVKEYSSISKYRSYRSHTKFLNKIFIYILYNSLLSAYMDLQKCGWKSAYFIKEKQKRKKTDENVRKTDTV